MRRGLTYAVGVCLVLWAAVCAAEPPDPDFRIAISSLIAARINPLGLEEQLRIGPQQRLYRSDKLALHDNFVFVGLGTKLSPAFLKIGPTWDVQPLSILNLRFSVELMKWFGTFNYLQSFATPTADYSDSTLSRLKDSAYTPLGVHFTFEPLLQMKFGPIALRNKLTLEYWAMNTRPGDTVFYDPTLDTLVPARGWVLTDDLDVVYVDKRHFVVGVRYSAVVPFYSPGDYLPGERQVNDNGHQRLGPIAAYTFRDRPRFYKPTLILIVNWFVEHRWRTGADVNPGVPYVVLAFAFSSELIPK